MWPLHVQSLVSHALSGFDPFVAPQPCFLEGSEASWFFVGVLVEVRPTASLLQYSVGSDWLVVTAFSHHGTQLISKDCLGGELVDTIDSSLYTVLLLRVLSPPFSTPPQVRVQYNRRKACVSKVRSMLEHILGESAVYVVICRRYFVVLYQRIIVDPIFYQRLFFFFHPTSS